MALFLAPQVGLGKEALFVKEKMMRRRQVAFVLSLAMLGVSLCSASAPGPASPPRVVVVVDAAGTLVGKVLGVMQGTRITIVGIELNQKVFSLEVLYDRFQRGTLFFTSADCTGPPYLTVELSPFPASAVSNPGNTLYGEKGPAQRINGGSWLEPDGRCNNRWPFQATAVPVKPYLDLDAAFTPPFHVEIW